jgi:hypothetical protein
MTGKQPQRNFNFSNLETWVILFFLAMIGYQIYSGIALKRIGIPHLFEVEFQDKITKFNSPEPKPSSPEPKPSSPEPKPSSPEPEPSSPEPQKTSINVAYGGDYLGCRLPIAINIANQRLYPQSNLFQVNDIEVGRQRYQISGNIYCPIAGQCQVYGEGFINVIPGNTYYIAWQNTRFAQCDAILQ